MLIPAATFAGLVDPQPKLHLEAPHAYTRFLRKFVGQRMRVVVSPWRGERRSEALNRYYWGVIVELLAEHCGYTREEMHAALKYRFLRDVAEPVHGFVKVGSTATLTNAETLRYHEDIRIFAATELDLFIPEPHEVSS